MNGRRGALLAAILLASACAGAANGRYGVRSVRFEGIRQVDPLSLSACLGTRERQRFSIDIGLRGTPECGEAPFDGAHAIIDPWSWPWTDWPLFDEDVFERDVERIERWYRARGFYDAHVVDRRVEPAEALTTDPAPTSCGDSHGHCEVIATFVIEEGDPVRVERMSLEGIDDLPDGMRQRLRSVLQMHRGDRFDEALYEETKRLMQQELARTGYARARVEGDVKINRTRHEVFIQFQVHSGPRSVIGRVCIVGYGRLPPDPMLGVAALDAGDTFTLEEIQEAQRQLYALGVFSGVEVEPVARPSDQPAPPVAQPTPTPEPRRCNPGPATVPPGYEAVDIDIRVNPGRVHHAGFGGGIQAGQSFSFGTITTLGAQTNASQWDVHLSTIFEDRNLFDQLIRARLEIRPRAIFQMPLFNFTPVETPFGVLVNASVRWPAFLEPRTNLVFSTRYDLGPMPFTNFFRSDLDAAVGPERWFFSGHVYAGIFVHGNWFYPVDRQPIEPRDRLPETFALWLEEIARIDFRDDPRHTTEGIYIELSAHQSVQPLSSWDMLRGHADVRGYISLPLGMVLAGRVEVGVMQIFGSSLPYDNVYETARLGPPALQLSGGGASGNRGFVPGLLGDAEQVYVSTPRSPGAIADGVPIGARPVRITAGNFLWQASIELRIPITTSFGVVLFSDAGDVDRYRTDVADVAPTFRLDHPQLSFGFGIRYLTPIGPLRFDLGIRPDDLQVLAQSSQLPPPCTTTNADHCRPASYVDFGAFRFPGAFHITIGEAF